MVKVPARSILPMIAVRDAPCITPNPANDSGCHDREWPSRFAGCRGRGTMKRLLYSLPLLLSAAIARSHSASDAYLTLSADADKSTLHGQWDIALRDLDFVLRLDDDGDGVLRGPELNGICLWEDRNGNGICDPGELRPVTDFGVVAIDCGKRRHETGISFNPQGILLRDGSSRATYDWIAASN